MSFFRKFAGVFIALIIGFGTLFVLLRIYNSFEARKTSPNGKHRELVDPGKSELFPQWNELGEFPPLSKVRYYGVENGQTRFDVSYEMDEKAFRKENSVPSIKNNHLLIGGCSFIFGVAIQKDETLTTFLRSKLPETQVVNIAHGGGGLHTQLRTFELINLKEYASPSKGTYIYFFFVDHLQRWIGNPSYLSWAQKDDIHYEWEGDKLVSMPLQNFKGYQDFLKARESGLDNVYIKTHAMQGLRDEDLVSYVKGIKALRESYLKQYPEGRFIFAFYPFMPDLESVKRLKVVLDKEKVFYHDFLDEFNFYVSRSGLPDNSLTVPMDGHPNKKFNDIFSDFVIKRFGPL